MPRDDSDSAISLFSFQDIITSLTGIMFLIVLLLMLMLLTSHTPQSGTPQQQTQHLIAEITRLKQEIAKLQNADKSADEELKKLQKLSPEKLKTMRQELQTLLQQKKVEKDAVDLANEKSSMELKQLQQQVEKLTAEEVLQQKTLARQQETLKKQQEILSKKQKELELKKNMIKYSVDQSSSKLPLLAELDASGIYIFDPSDKKYTDLRDKGNAAASLRKFNQYLVQIDKKRYYFTVAIKPGGFKYANTVLRMLKSSDFERGFEILPDDKSSILGDQKL